MVTSARLAFISQDAVQATLPRVDVKRKISAIEFQIMVREQRLASLRKVLSLALSMKTSKDLRLAALAATSSLSQPPNG